MGCKSLEKTKQKPKHKKGLWSPEEDQKLRNYILQFGHGCWSSVPINAGLQRNGKSCRLRWINYLRPGLKRGIFTAQEEETILNLHRTLGNKWSQIAQHLPGRTDNEIKNFWHSYLKKKVAKIEVTEPSEEQLTTSIDTVSSFQSFEVGEGSSMNSSEFVGNQKSCLPKLFFAEWLDFDNMNNSNQYEQNNIQGDQFSYYHSKDEDFISCNFDLQESFPQGVTYNEESYSNFPLYNEVGKETFDSQFRLEDQVQENGFGDLISNDLFMTNNLMYI